LRIVGKIVLFISFVFLMTSCFKEPEFSLSPEISFDSISSSIRLDQFIGATKDSVVVTIKFQDGDGDLGYNETQKTIAQESDNFNYIVRSFRKKNGKFNLYEPLIPLSGYFPSLKMDDKPGPIEGTLSYTIEFFHAFTPKKDTLKFEIQIKDAAGNISNVATSEEIVLNQI
jgi:hypothetical protein